MALIILGILLNSFHIVHDQPEFSCEEDPTHKLAAERQANYHFFKHQRARLLKRQKRVGQYGWLVLAVWVASSWFLYSDAVRTTTLSKQVSAIRTFAVADSKDAVVSLTLSDGSTVKYIVKAEPPVAHTPKSDEHSAEVLQNWELASLGTATNVGGATVPFGIALRMAN
jgi:hypothetical protein